MDRNCDNCKHTEKGITEEPCISCRNTSTPGTKVYEDKPFKWESEDSDNVNRPAHYTNRTIEEKNEVIQVYCEKIEDCLTCKIGDLCRSIKGAFLIHNDELSEAYSIVTNEGNPNDPVNKPSHYTDGKIEVIDYIEDKKLGFCLGNAIKYISRAGKKDPTKEIEDLKKAKWYIERRIKELEEA